jgi:hypothetical protein
MPHQLPGFLQDFINHRKEISKKVETPAHMKKVERGQVKPVQELETSIAYIIEKKPSEKAVKEYLKKRLEQLDAEKMKK